MGQNNRERVLAALLTCSTETEAAEVSGVADRTVRRFLADADFRRELSERRLALIDGAAGALQAKISAAIETIGEIMQNEKAKPTDRLAAAKAILDYGIRYTELYDLAKRIAAIEEVIGQ